MKILIVNAGSSSLKYQLVDMENENTLAKGLVERIGADNGHLEQKVGDSKFEFTQPIKDHVEACHHMIEALTDKEHGVVSNLSDIGAVGHRVLHGGAKFTQSMIINDEVIQAIEDNIPLGPLHNPANLAGIKACQQVMPGTPMVAVFDTAFHQTMPAKAYMYGVPMEYYERLKVRRYGFHGTSHRYVSKRTAEFLGVKPEEIRTIVCHLGNGSSLSAVKYGKCVDTSMGITPLEGVLMGTRSGSLDPAVVEFLCARENKTAAEIVNILNKKSGLLGVSEFSSDMRDVMAEAAKGNEACKLALDCWQYSIRKYIGSYAAAMGGLDMLVFTAGIGENNPVLRELLTNGLEFLGVKVDAEKNAAARGECDISAEGAAVRTWVIPTDEEMAIAQDTMDLVK